MVCHSVGESSREFLISSIMAAEAQQTGPDEGRYHFVPDVVAALCGYLAVDCFVFGLRRRGFSFYIQST
jgi:hypothetical protein